MSLDITKFIKRVTYNGAEMPIDSIVKPSGSVDAKFAGLVEGTITSVEESDLDGVVEIRDSAFIGCTDLTTASIPSSVTTIGANAFSGCTGLTSLTIAEGVTTIGANAFSGINASVIDIPSTITSVGESAFANNTALSTITIPSGIDELPANLFSGCTNLTEVTMEAETPPSVTDTTFSDSVTSIYVSYGAYDNYVAQWTTYADKIVRLPAIPSTITITVNNYLGEFVSGASVTITDGINTYNGTTDSVGVFMQGDLQPATYTIRVADLEGFKTPASQEVVVDEDTQNSVTVTYLEKPAFVPVDPVLANNSCETISAVSAEIAAKNMTSEQVAETYGWNIGDTINITLSTGETIEMRIIGFNHDNKSDGSGKAGITLDMTHCLQNDYSVNSSKTNAGGYSASMTRTITLPTIKSTLPEEWQKVILKVNKKSANGGGANYTETLTTSEELFLLSEIEVCGSVVKAQDGINEGSLYEYWSINNTPEDRSKLQGSNTDTYWWLRSCSTSDTAFCYVKYGGSIAAAWASHQRQVSFAFCI